MHQEHEPRDPFPRWFSWMLLCSAGFIALVMAMLGIMMLFPSVFE